MIGKTISHYRITSQLGVGGMGEVFLAEDTQLHCQRALKFLPVTVKKDSPDHTRLVNEARALAVLEHPNICPVQEIGEHEGQTFIVMSYLEGRTLKDRIAEGPLPLVEALDIARQISSGLAAAHAKGIVHRDIKPENIMLVEGNNETRGQTRAVLMDFGISKNPEATLATRTGTIMGTVAYMSPEQAQGIKVDSATDTWAVGVILYEMLSGQRPFPGDSEPALLYAIVNVDPEPLAGGDSEIPESVDRVVGKALAKDPKNRYADASELLEDIERAAEGEDVKGRRLGKGNRGRIIGAIAGAVSLICVAFFVWPGFLLPTDAISSLAVMPLEDRSGDPDRAFFAEGVADEMQKGLSKIGALTIVSRSSASQARELYESNREIGDRLGVDALVEGSVQREGDRVRVSVQLVATEDDRLIWSESYTRDMRDILNLQSEIALAVSAALETQLTPGEQENLERDRQIDPEAFEEYLLGLHFTSIATAESTEKAIEHYERALAIEPDWALAHYEISGAYLLNQQMAGLPPRSFFEKFRYHDGRAAELDPESADTIETKGWWAYEVDWDLETAGRYSARAKDLDPTKGRMG
jgi:serine/threonine protein kinase